MSYHIQYGVPTTVFRFATVIEPGEFLNEDGLPGLFLFSPAYNRVKDETGDDAEEREIIEAIKSLWSGEEKFLLSRNPNGTPYKQQFADVRDIVQGLVLGIEKDEALGEEFTLGGAALFKWEEAAPYLSERYNLDYVDAQGVEFQPFRARSHQDQDAAGIPARARFGEYLGCRRGDTARRERGALFQPESPWGKA